MSSPRILLFVYQMKINWMVYYTYQTKWHFYHFPAKPSWLWYVLLVFNSSISNENMSPVKTKGTLRKINLKNYDVMVVSNVFEQFVWSGFSGLLSKSPLVNGFSTVLTLQPWEENNLDRNNFITRYHLVKSRNKLWLSTSANKLHRLVIFHFVKIDFQWKW